MDVPVQYFQSVIAIELAVAGALLFEIRFFDRSDTAPRAGERRPHPGILILFAVVLSATLFGSLAAMLHGGQTAAASAITIGLAISLLPILLRVLPPLLKRRTDTERHPDSAFTVVGLLLYVAVVGGVIVLLNT